jgi:hypothetical protein
LSYLRQTKNSSQHQHHHQAAICIDRNIALLPLLHFQDRIAHGIPLQEIALVVAFPILAID